MEQSEGEGMSPSSPIDLFNDHKRQALDWAQGTDSVPAPLTLSWAYIWVAFNPPDGPPLGGGSEGPGPECSGVPLGMSHGLPAPGVPSLQRRSDASFCTDQARGQGGARPLAPFPPGFDQAASDGLTSRTKLYIPSLPQPHATRSLQPNQT